MNEQFEIVVILEGIVETTGEESCNMSAFCSLKTRENLLSRLSAVTYLSRAVGTAQDNDRIMRNILALRISLSPLRIIH